MRLDGDRETKAALNHLKRVAPQKAVDAINETQINVQAGAKELAAVDTGRMRASINFTPATTANLVATVSVNVDYGVHVEFGTSRMKAQPFLGPAFAVERPKLLPRLKKAIDEAGREAKRGGR